MSSPPGGTASPSRGSHLWNSLGNAPVVGLMAILAFVLSLGQAGVQVWQWWQSYHAKYAMDIKSPDDVNLFCAGSEGVDTPEGKRPICDGSNSVVLMTSPLTYINEAEGDKPVWLNREIARIRFENDAKKPINEIVLAWERIRSSASWEMTTTQQIDPKKTVSHTTLFYPASFGCEKDVSLTACSQANTYAWSDFATDVVSGRVKRAVFIFEPDFKGPSSPFPPRACEVTFDSSDVDRLQGWRVNLAKTQNEYPGQSLKGIVSPPYAYLSHRCVQTSVGK
jgi:hypothetical protein